MKIKIETKDVLSMEAHSVLWDTIIIGFHVRRQYSDIRTFGVFYRDKTNKQKWHKIGRFGVWTVEQARNEAKRILRNENMWGENVQI